MAVPLEEIVKRLMERNPDLRHGEAVDALMAQVEADASFKEQTMRYVFDKLYTIVEKSRKGVPLTEDEQDLSDRMAKL